MYQTILVPLDGNPENEVSLKHAAALAKAFEAKLILFMAVPHPVYPPPRYSVADADSWLIKQRQLKEDALHYLESIAQRPDLEGLNVEWTIGEGPKYKLIQKAIDQYKVDVVVMTKRKRSRIARWVLGSTPLHTLRESPVPVLLVKA